MRADEIMTRDVITVPPDMAGRAIARLLIEHNISAVPVVDASGAPIGMVSEGDLLSPSLTGREERRDRWLEMLAEGEPLNPEFLAQINAVDHVARDIMGTPVITVSDSADIGEVARLLSTYRIKRVPVVRDGRVVGIVSRADLVRALAAPQAPAAPAKERRASARGPAHEGPATAGGWQPAGEAIHEGVRPTAAAPPPPSAVTASDFRLLVAHHEQDIMQRRNAERAAAAAQSRQMVRELIDHHVTDGYWQNLLHDARVAAERGETEFLLLRFPSSLCEDGGRAINAPEPDWPRTLRGEAAEMYLRWEADLKHSGFHLAARVLDFPGGVPGDIGLFLVWGK